MCISTIFSIFPLLYTRTALKSEGLIWKRPSTCVWVIIHGAMAKMSLCGAYKSRYGTNSFYWPEFEWVGDLASNASI